MQMALRNPWEFSFRSKKAVWVLQVVSLVFCPIGMAGCHTRWRGLAEWRSTLNYNPDAIIDHYNLPLLSLPSRGDDDNDNVSNNNNR